MNLRLRPISDSDFEFAFEVKRDAMGSHILARWAWDEKFQLQHHMKKWVGKPWQIICFDGKDIGTVSEDFQAMHMQFGEFYILAPYRRQGIGTEVLVKALRKADELCLETRLEYLKGNPVANLYARHGFRVMRENDTHYFLVRKPNAAQRNQWIE